MIIDTKDLNKCYGCFACANICPKNCIQLKQDEEGFFMPVVDGTKCIECGACDRVCIIGKNNGEIIQNHKKRPRCYYGYLKDDTLRKHAMSGGLSYALAIRTIQRGGVVFGVVGKWFEDVHHIRVETIEELTEILGSKYVQSYIGDCYRQAKKDLEANRYVFFTGTPCQIAGLYSYLGKDYDKLLTADLLCHGVPSQLVLKAELEKIEKKKGKIKEISRNNKYQFSPSQYIIEYEDGREDVIDEKGMAFRKGFVANLLQRKSCNNCSFSRLERIGDITMGDIFAGFGRKPLNVMDPKNIGVSAVIVNSEKGRKALLEIDDIFEKGPMTLYRMKVSHSTLVQGITASERRTEFFECFLSKGFDRAEDIIDTAYGEWKRERIKLGEKHRIEVKRNLRVLFTTVFNKIIDYFI